MKIKKLYNTIIKQNLYMEQILLQSIQLIKTKKSEILSKNEMLMLEYNLVVLSSYLLTEISLVKRKRNIYIYLMNTLEESNISLNNKLNSLISNNLLNDLKKIEFSNELYGIQFNENLKRLELNLVEVNKKKSVSVPLVDPWLNQEI